MKKTKIIFLAGLISLLILFALGCNNKADDTASDTGKSSSEMVDSNTSTESDNNVSTESGDNTSSKNEETLSKVEEKQADITFKDGKFYAVEGNTPKEIETHHFKGFYDSNSFEDPYDIDFYWCKYGGEIHIEENDKEVKHYSYTFFNRDYEAETVMVEALARWTGVSLPFIKCSLSDNTVSPFFENIPPELHVYYTTWSPDFKTVILECDKTEACYYFNGTDLIDLSEFCDNDDYDSIYGSFSDNDSNHIIIETRKGPDRYSSTHEYYLYDCKNNTAKKL